MAPQWTDEETIPLPVHPMDRHIGARIRLRRTLRGLSQPALGERIGGMSFQQVQKYEAGHSRIYASRLWLAAEVLEVPISFFFDDYPGDKKVAAQTDGRHDLDALAMARAFASIKSRQQRQALVTFARLLAKA